MAQQSLVGQGLLSIEASRSHSDTQHSVGLLWTSDQLDADTSTSQNTTLRRDGYPFSRRDLSLQSQRARGGVVVKALHYKPAGRGFDSRWCH